MSEQEPKVSSEPTPAPDSTTDKGAELTPLRAHYLKKALLDLQFNHELGVLISPSPSKSISILSYLGPPFTALPKDIKPADVKDLPFLRFIFNQFILTFPFLASAPKDFFPSKLQPFIDSVIARNLTSSISLGPQDNENDEEIATREKMLVKIEKHMGLLLGSALKLTEKEEVVRLTQKDLDRLQAIAEKRSRNRRPLDVFDVNVVCVRVVTTKGRLRNRHHEEFIVRTRRSGEPDVFVSRRYGDFRTLAEELRKAHPTEEVKAPPQKDKSATAASSTLASIRSSGSSASLPEPGLTRTATMSSIASATPLQREKNRLTLRGYLNGLLSSAVLASSPVLKSFLLSEPTTLTPEEETDAKRRVDLDQMREEGRKKFALEIGNRVDKLRQNVMGVKGDIMGPDGLTRIFATVKKTENVSELPQEYKAVIEWGRISLASAIFQQLVASDSASETFANLKRLHGLMPYFMLKGILKISNPIAMIRGVLDLFLAQPFGGKSLLQRMFTGQLSEEISLLQEDIEAVHEKIDDPVICEKVRRFVESPKEFQEIFQADAVSEKKHLLSIILRSPETPTLNRAQLQRVFRASRAHAEYLRHRESLFDSDDDEGPENDEAWLYEDLTVLIKLYTRLRDRQQLIALIFEGTTSDLLKDIITIFYAPLAQVYKAASIGDSLNDAQNFMNDLIRTVEQVEELGQENPHRTVQVFIDLVQRHEQAFYTFVHKVHSKGEGLFDNLIKWMQFFFTIMRDGLGDPVNLEYVLPHTGQARLDVLKEVDDFALYHYKLKLAYESKVRRRFGEGKEETAEDEEATQAVFDRVLGDVTFGELMKGDVDDITAQETSSEEESSEEETTEESEEEQPPPPRAQRTPSQSHQKSASQTSIRRSISERQPQSPTPPQTPSRSFFSRPSNGAGSPRQSMDRPPPSPAGSSRVRSSSQTPARRASEKPQKRSRRKRETQNSIRPPQQKALPELLPLFVELVQPLLKPRAI
ncbi:hypothetical protein BOTBODRAFT_26762 [Botryobasidium botryosum FD-172 SS1]|uniref:PX domain-containing protein n=1 Tax=Botryobasidium botryosum (strain FD-172 SS1) TaxID=930990 RepID=A0A067N1C3_BOTB1|nr:hypothetical protein BOTBODRAFT_26762 [Botryobasidium botryosum FD-172 SS1]